VLTLCNSALQDAARKAKQTWAAVQRIRVLTPLQHKSTLQGTLQEAQNKHGSCARGSGADSATGALQTLQQAYNNDGSCVRGSGVPLLCNLCKCCLRKQTWAAVPEDQVLTPLQHSALQRTLQERKQHAGCAGIRSADSSVTQCTTKTLQRAHNNDGSCVRGSEC
jgi:hypothetical protein